MKRLISLSMTPGFALSRLVDSSLRNSAKDGLFASSLLLPFPAIVAPLAHAVRHRTREATPHGVQAPDFSIHPQAVPRYFVGWRDCSWAHAIIRGFVAATHPTATNPIYALCYCFL